MSIKDIVDNLPIGKSDLDIVSYLSDVKTIQKASAIPAHKIPLLEVKMRDAGCKVGYITDFLRSVRGYKKKQSLQNKTKNPTHIEISKRFLATGVKDKTIYCRGDYWRYKDGVWEVYQETFLKNELQTLLETLESTYPEITFTSGVQASILEFMRQKIAIADDVLDGDVNLINMGNGVFDLSQRMLMIHSPKHYVTTQLPFDFQAGMDCKNFKKYLETSLVKPRETGGEWEADQEVIDFLQEAIGYSLTANTSHHKMFWCIGDGSNGKGVLFHILQKLGGNAAIPISLDSFNQSLNTYELAMIAGKRIAYCTEVSTKFDFEDDATLKRVVAGEGMPVRQIRDEPFILTPIAKVWVSLNKLPYIKDTSKGFWRRLCIIPFHRIFDETEQDINLKERLEKELPGIFNWAMEGLYRLLDRGKFKTPKQVRDITKHYQISNNPVAVFIEDCCKEKLGNELTKKTAYDAYKNWAQDNGYHKLSSKNFISEMERMGMVYKRNNTGQWRFFDIDIPLSSPFSQKI